MSNALPWHEWDGDLGPDGDVVYVRLGKKPGERSLLAQSFKLDGVSTNAAESYRDAERAELILGFVGHRQDSLWEVACNSSGDTLDGDFVVDVVPCVFAVLGERDR